MGEPLGTDLLREADDEPLTATADEAGTGLQDSLEQAVTPEEPVQAEPEEQPYERGGRWYFRRGDEFLVYEEATGQWVAAEETGPGTSSAAGGNAATPAGAEAATIAGEQPVDLAETAELTQVGETPVERGESSPQAGFWKCPSCGTVNGSTAASCRMCFALRP